MERLFLQERTFMSRVSFFLLVALTSINIGAIAHAGGHVSAAGPSTYVVSANSELAVVGARWNDGYKGVVYVLAREGDGWTEVQRLSPDDLGPHDHFGSTVFIEGDMIVVGAPWQSDLRGAAYVYERGRNGWALDTKLTVDDARPGLRFGTSVFVEAGDVVVGAGRIDAGSTAPLSGYRFVHDAGTWRRRGQSVLREGMLSAETSDESVVTPLLSHATSVYGAPPRASAGVPDPPKIVIATDGVFEARVEVSWSDVGLDAIIYKILRDGALISIVNSDDSTYVDDSGVRGVVYDYCVVVEDMDGLESAPACDPGSRIIYAPDDVSASDGHFTDGVRVAWNDRSSVETGYYLRRNGAPIDTLATNAQTAVDGSAMPNITYTYEVVAFDAAGSLSAANSDTGFRGVVLPPLDVSASDGEHADSVLVTWTDQTEEDDSFIVSRVNLTTADSTVLDTTAVGAESYADDTAQAGTRYRYCVTTLDAVRQLSVPVCDDGGVDFPAPLNVAASDSTYDDRVAITWDDPSDLEDGFWILRDGTPIDTIPSNSESYDDEDATPDATHTYCVVAFSDAGGSSDPAAACDPGYRMIVLAPTAVTASDGDFENHVTITWESSSSTAVLFKILRDGTLIKSVGPDQRTYDDAAGTANQVYTYSVQALTALADESAPASDDGYRELAAPTAAAATDNAFEDRVEISWTDNSLIESGFAVYRAPTGTPLPGTLVGESGANVTSVVDHTAVPGTRYVYSVTAFDTDGEARGESNLDDDEGWRALAVPGAVGASDGEFEDRVEVLWEDRSNVEDGYRIYRDDTLIGETADNTTSFIDANPMLGVVSDYSVRAFDAYGTSDVDTDSGHTTVFAPASLNASDTYPQKVVLRWVDVSEIEAGYLLRVDSMGVTVHTDTIAANSTSFEHVPSVPAQTRTYRLRAFAGPAVSDAASDEGQSLPPEFSAPAVAMEEKIRPDSEDPDDLYGASVVMDEDIVMVGAPFKFNSGRFVVYSRNSDLTWNRLGTYLARDRKPTDEFGAALALSGDYVLVGMPGRQSDYENEVGRSGLALIFQRNPDDDTWSEWEVLRPTGEQAPDFLPEDNQDRFGESVAMNGATNEGGGVAIVGARGDDVDDRDDLGSVYFVTQSVNRGWDISGKHFASDSAAFDEFGAAVAINGEWAFVGAPGDDDAGAESGSAYIFRRDTDGSWQEITKVASKAPSAGAGFGGAMAMNGNAAFVGSPEGIPGKVDVFVVDDDGGAWVHAQTLKSGTDAVTADGFGRSISVNGDRLIVGANEFAFLFVRDDLGSWSVDARLVAGDGEPGDQFGAAVAAGEEWAFVGAPEDDIGDQKVDTGSLYSLLLLASVTNVTASDGEFNNRVHIEWEDQSQAEQGVIIFRDGMEYDRLDPNEDFYDDLDAEPGRTYEYGVAPINEFAGLESEREPDFGWRPPDGNITGRVTTELGTGVSDVTVCLEPAGTGALLFDGTGGHVRVPDDGTFDFGTSETFTIEVWFKYDGTDRSPRVITKLSQSGIEERPLDLGLQRSGRVFFVTSDGVNFARVLSQRSGLDDDRWHHVACVHDAASKELSLYVDGVLEDVVGTAALGDITNNSDIFVGGFDDGTWFGGQVDELRIWNVARSESQIGADRNRALEGNEEGLIGYWAFDALAGRSITDFAGEAQYGRFVDGVYRTTESAPLDVCVTTDSDGNFEVKNIRYEETGTTFRVRPSLPRHEFSPPVQAITLSAGHPVENQVNFNDVSSFTLSGRVQFEGSTCFQRDVQFFVDGDPAGSSDKNGKFSLSTDEGMHTITAELNDYEFWVVLDGDTMEADSLTIEVVDDVPNILFLNTTKHTASGNAGGSCNTYVGDIRVRYRSESSCLDTTIAGNPEYTVDLPPLVYLTSATVDPATIPPGLSKTDVISFYQNLGERELDLTTVVDTTLDFTYRAPIKVTITGFEDYITCEQLTLEDGTPLPPNTPIVPQLEHVDLVITVEEDYGTSVCPLDSGTVIITDEIFDQENDPDTLTVKDGVVEYATFASTPSLVAGRTDGADDRSFQKAITATAVVEGRPNVSDTEWVLVTGRVAPPGAEFVTFTADVPIHILRDPPGDGSSAFLEKGFSTCLKVGLATSLTLETGLELESKFGFAPETFVGLGGGFIVKAGGTVTLNNKFTIGTTITTDLSTELCLTTNERYSTSSSGDFVGESGDVYIGAGVNFLFTEAGTIDVNDDCRVTRGTTVAFEPDAVNTAYAFTESHIENVLIPELDEKAELLEEERFRDSFAAQADNWRDIVEQNRELKEVALKVENRSFSAGTSYEYSVQNSTSTSFGGSIKLYTSLENSIGTDVDVNLFGAKAKVAISAFVNIKTEVTTSAGGGVTGTRAVGYTLSDDDVGDNFTVDIKLDPRFISPVFQCIGGKSSCPYEPWPDLDSGEPNMVARDRLALRIGPQQPEDIPPPDDAAVMKLTLENQSDETRTYELRSLSVSNPGGAIMKVNGSPIAGGLPFTIAPESAHEATLAVERGPTQYYYPGLQLALAPECGSGGGIEDIITFDVAFQSECSDITLFSPESGWNYNEDNEEASDTIEMILVDYELLVSPVDSLSVEEVGVQFRHLGADRDGPDPWTDVLADSVGLVETLLQWKPDESLPDGVYELRAFAQCNTGGRGFSATATGTIDRNGPEVFGTPEPSDGAWSLGEDIRITFNEPVECGSIAPAAITLIYADGPESGTPIPVKTVCNDLAIILNPESNPNDLEGRRLTAEVGGITDLVGNTMAAPVTWSFDVRRSLFTWSRTQISRDVALGEPGGFDAELANGTSQPVDFKVTELPAFLAVAPLDGEDRIAPGATRAITFDIEDSITGGAHAGQVTAIAMDTTGTDTTAVALLDVFLDVACVAPQWVVNAGDFEYSMSIVGVIEEDGTGTPIEDASDRLAAFVGGELRGVAAPTDVGGPKRVFLTVYANRPANEMVRFEVWDDDGCKRYPAALERFPFSADSVIGTAAAPVTLTATETVPVVAGEFALDAGWNWFSTNVVSTDMSVVNVLSSLSPTAGDIIKSKTAFAMFDPSTADGWVGTLATLDNVSGYMIRLTDAATLLQDGSVVDPSATPIPIDLGWNWISYARSTASDVTTSLADLESQGLLAGDQVIKGQSQFSQWDAGSGDWLGSLSTMTPGEGYRLFLDGGSLPGSFTYPDGSGLALGSSGTLARAEDNDSRAALPWAAEPNRYQHNMTIIAEVHAAEEHWNSASGAIGAFVGSECRGTVQLMFVEGADTYFAFVTVHSNQLDGETVKFRAHDSSSGITYDVTETVPFEADAVLGTVGVPLVLSTGAVRDGRPDAFQLMQNRPNPFNPRTTIRFALPQARYVTLRIYNVRGQLVRTLGNRIYGAGTHRVDWDGSTVSGATASSGVYFYRIEAGSFTDVKKMILLK